MTTNALTLTARERRRDRLHDIGLNNPEFTNRDVMAWTGWEMPWVNQAIRDLRNYLGATGDPLNLVCEPDGWGPWTYRLTSDDTRSRTWTGYQARTIESKLQTLESVATSMASATKGSSTAGKLARKVQRTAHYLRAELADLDGRTV